MYRYILFMLRMDRNELERNGSNLFFGPSFKGFYDLTLVIMSSLSLAYNTRQELGIQPYLDSTCSTIDLYFHKTPQLSFLVFEILMK